VNALQYNTTGGNNTASGYEALFNNTTGSSNIAVGFQAGANLTTGSNNIDIGSKGAAAESDTIRIGIAATHKATVIAGIYGTSVTGSAVVVSSTGRLGVTMSSERYKTAIAPMGANTAKLGQLRPVTFHLKTDPKGALQYGLIAEEVAKVYPELVIRNETGRIDGVRYDELAPMLLNEVQKKNAALDAEIRELKRQVAVISAALRSLQAKDELIANR
jgi:Chaperone of endosialidase